MSEGSPTEEFGPYIVYEQLGVGGMAQVHRAVTANPELPSQIALKRMLSHLTSSEDMVRSFVREARLASFLHHKNVARTYDVGRVGDIYFIAMELITGRNLREVLRHCGSTTGPMPVPVALNILNQICDALDYAHNLCDQTGRPLGIIHRDVSPSNVIVSDTGVVKLIDFGIAKASGAGLQTMSGTLKGKFAYMAPEYIGGQLDARADLFAVGVIAHELLTNRPLFSGRDDIDTLNRVRDMQIDPPSQKNSKVPPEIDDIVMTALARDPERRWQHATALRCALTTLTQRLGLVATDAQAIEWLDWVFSLPRRITRDTDTETDAVPVPDEPSIVIEPSSLSQKITLLRGDGPPGPPSQTPIGTPAHAPAQRSSTRAHTVELSASAAERSSRRRLPTDAQPSPGRARSSTDDLPTPSELRSRRRPATDAQPAPADLHGRGRPPTDQPTPSELRSRRRPPTDAPLAPADRSSRHPRLPDPPSPADHIHPRLPDSPSPADRSGRYPRLPDSPAPADRSGRYPRLPDSPSPADRSSRHPRLVPAAPRVPMDSTSSRADRLATDAPAIARTATSPSSAPGSARGPADAVVQPASATSASIASTIHGSASPITATGHAANPAVRGPTASPAPMAQAPGPPRPAATAVYASPAPPVRMPSASTAPVSTHGASAQAVPTPVSSRRAASVHATVRASPVHGTPAGNRAPAPAIPSFNAAPLGAPRPSTPSQPPAFDPARSAIVQREFELRASASARTAGAATYAETPRTLAVILVVLVAAAAAISVYFVLPLLT